MRYLLVLLVALLTACAPTSTPTPAPTAIPDNFLAPDFQLETLGGQSIRLSDLRGQWVIVNFWATWCVPCATEMPIFQQIAEEFGADWVVLGINNREQPDIVQDFVNRIGIRFPILMNPDDGVLLNYQVVSLPQTFVVNPQGEIVWRQFGPIQLSAFRQTMLDLMSA